MFRKLAQWLTGAATVCPVVVIAPWRPTCCPGCRVATTFDPSADRWVYVFSVDIGVGRFFCERCSPDITSSLPAYVARLRRCRRAMLAGLAAPHN
jgi:hypothetical protein